MLPPDNPEFARELPRFVAHVRRMFTSQQIRAHIARVEREQSKKDVDPTEDDELIVESPVAAAEHTRQFALIKELLTAAELGTS